MKPKDLHKLAGAVQSAVAHFEASKAIQLRAAQRKKLEQMAEDIALIAEIVDRWDQTAAALERRIKTALAQAKTPTVPRATRAIVQLQREEDRLIAEHGKRAQDPNADPRARASHQALYEQLCRSRDISRASQQNLDASEGALVRIEGHTDAAWTTYHARKAMDLLQALRSKHWLEELHRETISQQARAWAAEFKREKKRSLPQWLEDITLKLLQAPRDLSGALITLLEIRRKLARMNFDTPAEVELLLVLAEQTKTIAQQARTEQRTWQRLLEASASP